MSRRHCLNVTVLYLAYASPLTDTDNFNTSVEVGSVIREMVVIWTKWAVISHTGLVVTFLDV